MTEEKVSSQKYPNTKWPVGKNIQKLYNSQQVKMSKYKIVYW